MGANLDASAKQAETTNAAIHGLDESVKTVTDSIEAQTKTVTELGTKQSKVTKEITKALETQNSQQKDANTTLAKQKKIMQEQDAEIKKVTKALRQLSCSSVLRASATALRTEAGRQAATMPSGLTSGSAYALMSRTAPGVHHPGIMINEP